MNDDVATANGGAGIRRVRLIRTGHLVVVHHHVTLELVPDLDAEPVYGRAGREHSINGTEQKPIAPGAVDGPHALAHGLPKSAVSHRVFLLGMLALLHLTCGATAP